MVLRNYSEKKKEKVPRTKQILNLWGRIEKGAVAREDSPDCGLFT